MILSYEPSILFTAVGIATRAAYLYIDSNKLKIFSDIAVYYGDTYLVTLYVSNHQ